MLREDAEMVRGMVNTIKADLQKYIDVKVDEMSKKIARAEKAIKAIDAKAQKQDEKKVTPEAPTSVRP